ncbi:MAG: DUF2924 domain-containing protein [Afipia sp.]
MKAVVKTRPARRTQIRESSIEVEIAHLRDLDLSGLRARWKGEFRREPAPHLPRHLLFAVLAYHIQASRLGDLQADVKTVLDRSIPGEKRSVTTAWIAKLDRQRIMLIPGTILTRSWNGRSERVMVMADGFGWNGKIYRSLSKVASAITGTRWNGPRFFGLRDKEVVTDRDAAGQQP